MRFMVLSRRRRYVTGAGKASDARLTLVPRPSSTSTSFPWTTTRHTPFAQDAAADWCSETTPMQTSAARVSVSHSFTIISALTAISLSSSLSRTPCSYRPPCSSAPPAPAPSCTLSSKRIYGRRKGKGRVGEGWKDIGRVLTRWAVSRGPIRDFVTVTWPSTT